MQYWEFSLQGWQILDSCLAPVSHLKTFNLHALSTFRSEKACHGGVLLGCIKLVVHHTWSFRGAVFHQIPHPHPGKVWPPRVTEIEGIWWERSKSKKTKKHKSAVACFSPVNTKEKIETSFLAELKKVNKEIVSANVYHLTDGILRNLTATCDLHRGISGLWESLGWIFSACFSEI